MQEWKVANVDRNRIAIEETLNLYSKKGWGVFQILDGNIYCDIVFRRPLGEAKIEQVVVKSPTPKKKK